ncbi:hypothetical protein E4T43_05493 [Aureobasidium subglaciale]|nr:hypothetical protein E4T43_05493 [Aureobasidium subglaciale]
MQFFIFSLFLAVNSLVIEQRSCVSLDVTAIAQQVSNPHYFCAWYLSECITSVEPKGTQTKNLEAIAKAARLHSFVGATCSSTSTNPVGKEFKSPSSFCSFFNSFRSKVVHKDVKYEQGLVQHKKYDLKSACGFHYKVQPEDFVQH